MAIVEDELAGPSLQRALDEGLSPPKVLADLWRVLDAASDSRARTYLQQAMDRLARTCARLAEREDRVRVLSVPLVTRELLAGAQAAGLELPQTWAVEPRGRRQARPRPSLGCHLNAAVGPVDASNQSPGPRQTE